jgi:hypothetical protein
MRINQPYTYIWMRDHNSTYPKGSPYYIGKGVGRRGFVSWSHSVRCPKDCKNIQILLAKDGESAFEAERFLIKYYGRIDLGTGCLRNQDDGGLGGTSNISEATRARMSASAKVKIRTPEGERHRLEAHRIRLTGVPLSAEHREKISLIHRGLIPSSFGRRRICLPSLLCRQRALEANLGRKAS